MKKIFALFFVAVFLITNIRYYIVFSAMNKQAKMEMSLFIESGKVDQKKIELTFSLKDLAQKIHFTNSRHTEFVFQNHRYDVIELKNVNGKITISCIEDEKETRLFSLFTKKIDEQTSSSSRSGIPSQKQITPDWIYKEAVNTNPFFVSTLLFNHQTSVVFADHSEILSPPPKG